MELAIPLKLRVGDTVIISALASSKGRNLAHVNFNTGTTITNFHFVLAPYRVRAAEPLRVT